MAEKTRSDNMCGKRKSDDEFGAGAKKPNLAEDGSDPLDDYPSLGKLELFREEAGGSSDDEWRLILE